ncbi:MAG: hypothetical protein ABJB86_05895 [Bacteroidota bacterium]
MITRLLHSKVSAVKAKEYRDYLLATGLQDQPLCLAPLYVIAKREEDDVTHYLMLRY